MASPLSGFPLGKVLTVGADLLPGCVVGLVNPNVGADLGDGLGGKLGNSLGSALGIGRGTSLDAPFDPPLLGIGEALFSGTIRVGIVRKFFSDVGRKNFSGAPGNRDFSDLCSSFPGWKGRALHEFVSER